MPLHTINPTQTAAWQKLQAHFDANKDLRMQDLFAEDAQRVEKFHLHWKDFLLDYSKNRITAQTMTLLHELANEMGLSAAIQSYVGGDAINQTENRAVLHTALRSKETSPLLVDGVDIRMEIAAVKAQIKEFSERIISGAHKGFTGKSITDIVNIGIGGSDLGPAMLADALAYYQNHLNVHFVSNVDGDHVQEVLKKVNPETTLFVIVSKTFTTQETLTNAQTIREWFLTAGSEADIAAHFVAVSTNLQRVQAFGIASENTFPMWDWVGGRFSLWSAVGLSIALVIGYEQFEQLLNGAADMDAHFTSAPFEENMPVIMALLSIWYNNFYGSESEALIPFTQYLQKLAPYLQQGIMESNGKSMGRDGQPVNYQTGTIIWGEPGTNSQHAFFQLIHQGTKLIPTDFIGFKKSLHGNTDHHDKLMANFFAQTEALLMGKTANQVSAEFEKQHITGEYAAFLLPFKVFAGNKPTNTLLIEKLTPANLGSLLALYEHKLFVQGVIWNIFSYDQWGVELGKQLATSILDEMNGQSFGEHDGSTGFLLSKYCD
jgi:glucose-6-phosphate isomerase